MKKIISMNDLAATVKERRLETGLSQNALAQKAKVSREWIVQFEAGKVSAQTFWLLKVLEALNLFLSSRKTQMKLQVIAHLHQVRLRQVHHSMNY
ncbi:MAG: helix-turn-helix transcriptional regulator [Actinomycetota bacterium]|nr:helix-turn-helix transcriptional regulator [Actinomycetota bacterium]